VSFPETFKLILHKQEDKGSDKVHPAQLTDRQLRALAYLKSNESLTAAQYQRVFGISKSTATRDLTEMAHKGVVIAVGKGKWLSYRLPD